MWVSSRGAHSRIYACLHSVFANKHESYQAHIFLPLTISFGLSCLTPYQGRRRSSANEISSTVTVAGSFPVLGAGTGMEMSAIHGNLEADIQTCMDALRKMQSFNN